MREYELFYLVGETKEAELPRLRSEIEAMVKEKGGEFLPAETSDKRRLAYEIKGETRGFYIARRFTLPDFSDLVGAELEAKIAEGDVIAGLTRKLALSKDILRVLFLRAEELPELKAIERTEYNRRETRGGRAPRRERGTADAPVAASTPAASPTTPVEPEKTVSKEEMDKQLSEDA